MPILAIATSALLPLVLAVGVVGATVLALLLVTTPLLRRALRWLAQTPRARGDMVEPDAATEPRGMASALGLQTVPRGVLLAAGALWAVFFAALVLVFLKTVADILWLDEAEADILRSRAFFLTGSTVALGAVIALPFTLIRTAQGARQTRTAEENLITDLVTKAVEGLAAVRERTRFTRTVAWWDGGEIRKEFEWQDAPALPRDAEIEPDQTTPWAPVAVTEPNIEVRIGAIHSLERLLKTADQDDYRRILQILCAYLRENCRAESPDPELPPPDPGSGVEGLQTHDISFAQYNRAHTVQLRADLHAVFAVLKYQIAFRHEPDLLWQLGRTGSARRMLDLSRIDLRRVDLTGADLTHADLQNARLGGATLEDAHLADTDLRRANMNGTILDRSTLDNADLTGTRLRQARLSGTSLRGVKFDSTLLQGAYLQRVNFDGAHLRNIRPYTAEFFSPASLRGAALHGVNLAGARSFNPELLRQAFGDGSCTLPDGWTAGEGALAHWAAEPITDLEEFEERWRAWRKRSGAA